MSRDPTIVVCTAGSWTGICRDKAAFAIENRTGATYAANIDILTSTYSKDGEAEDKSIRLHRLRKTCIHCFRLDRLLFDPGYF